jgi:glycosyltransferase involved in cell wall biosynthesis
VRSCAPDAVLLIYIGFMYRYQFMITFLPTFMKRMLSGVPFVTRFENVMGADPRKTTLSARLIRKAFALVDRRGEVNYGFGTLLRDSDRLIVLSESQLALLQEIHPGCERRATLIPPPANMRVIVDDSPGIRRRGRMKMGLRDSDFVIAYLGYIYRGKGIETLLRAFQLAARGSDSMRLVIIGGAQEPGSGVPEGYVETLVGLSRDLGIADRVRWMGEYTWDREDASLYLRASDLGVLPFRDGVYLNHSSLASMMAHGLPIISTRGARLEEAFVDRENVFLCPSKSAEALASAITIVAENPELRQRLAAGSVELTREWFSWDRATERTLQVLSAGQAGRSQQACKGLEGGDLGRATRESEGNGARSASC